MDLTYDSVQKLIAALCLFGSLAFVLLAFTAGRHTPNGPLPFFIPAVLFGALGGWAIWWRENR